MPNSSPVIFYDGVCGLCDRSIQFIINHDKEGVFRFAPLQSEFARQTLKENINLDSFVYYENGRAWHRSTGALKTFRKLGGIWALMYGFMIVPRFIRDGIYNWIAKHRYQWFGKFDACKIPTPEQKERFIG